MAIIGVNRIRRAILAEPIAYRNVAQPNTLQMERKFATWLVADYQLSDVSALLACILMFILQIS
jgi:hypothetical protein